jgi:hypothetical protein
MLIKLIGPEPACSISMGVARKAVKRPDNKRPQEIFKFLKWTQTGRGTHMRTLS